MTTPTSPLPAGYTAFSAGRRIAGGALPGVVREAKQAMEERSLEQVLIFEDRNGAQIDIDLHGPLDLILKHLPGMAEETTAPAPRTAGRPKLGVVAREVTLLPRHWEWLNGQPGGASVTLRKLVEDARRQTEGSARQSHEACYRFMLAAGGNLPDFEQAARALFAGDGSRFREVTAGWPADLRDYALTLAGF